MRIQIHLSESEFERIAALAHRERRDPPDQIVYMALKAIEKDDSLAREEDYRHAE